MINASVMKAQADIINSDESVYKKLIQLIMELIEDSAKFGCYSANIGWLIRNKQKFLPQLIAELNLSGYKTQCEEKTYDDPDGTTIITIDSVIVSWN